jgi:hypothetical protein
VSQPPKICGRGHAHSESRCPECQRMYDRRYRRSPRGREKDRLWQLAHYDPYARSERYLRLEWPRALAAQREALLDQVELLRFEADEFGLGLGPELLAHLQRHRPDGEAVAKA